MTQILFKRIILSPHQTATAVWWGGVLVSLCFFLIPFFVSAITLVEELNSLEQQMVILEAEIARSEQGVPGSLSKQELLRQYETLKTRIQAVTAQIQEVPAAAPSIAVISPTQDQRIEGKAGTSFTIQWRTENWGAGALANIEMIRQSDGVTVLARSGVPSPNNITNTTSVNIRTNATITKTYKVRVFAVNNPSVSAESGWFVIALPIPPMTTPAADVDDNTFVIFDDFTSLDRIKLAKLFYQQHPEDSYDFLYFFYDEDAGSGADFVSAQSSKAFLSSVQFSFNVAQLYGSKGILLGTLIDHATLTNLDRGGFIDTLFFGILQHELFHYWGVYLPESLKDARCDSQHWVGYVGSRLSCGGDSNSKFVEKDNNYYFSYNCAGIPKFHDFELYSMGLKSAEDIKEKVVIYNQKKDFINNLRVYGDCEKITEVPEEYISKSYSIQDFINILGPSVRESKNNFNVAFILVKPLGLNASDDEIKSLHWWAEKAPIAWYKATEGLSTLNNKVPKNNISPVISNVEITKDISQIRVSWQTDKPAVSAVFLKNTKFGYTRIIYRSKLSPPDYSKNHLIIINSTDDSNISFFGTQDFEIGKVISVDENLNISTLTPIVGDFPKPSITILSPNGGEPWIFGEKQKISWQKNGTIPPQAVIAAYISKGDQVSAFPYSGYAKDDKRTGDMPANSGYFEWTVPLNSSVPFIRQGGGDYRIKVVMAVDGKIIARDVSDSPFTIFVSSAGGGQPPVATPPNQLPTTVLYPNGGENITQGQLSVIQWTSELPDTFNYNLTLLDARGETVIREIDSNRPKGKYAWYVPSDVPPGQYRVRVGGAGALSSDTSNAAFTIVARQIAVSQVTSPRNNQPPVVKSIAGPTSVVAGSQNTWTIVAADPDGQSVSVSAYSIGADLISGDLFAKSSATKGTEQSFSWSFIFREAGTYPLIVTAKDSEGAVSASTQFLVSAMPSEIKVSIANSPTAPAGVVFPGTEKTLGAFDMTVVGEPVSVDRVAILVEGGSALVHDLYLYDENGVKFEQRVDDTRGPAFPRPKIVFPVGTHTYTVKGTVEATTPFGTAVGIGVHPGSWHNAVGTITGRPATIPTQIILLSMMTVKTPSLGFSASRAGTVRSPTVAPGTKEVPITLYRLDGTVLEEDTRVPSLSLSYDDYGSNTSGAPQLEACRLSASGEPLMSGANIVAPPVGPFGSVTSVDVSFAFDAPLVVSKGTIKELTLICNVASAAVGRFSFGIGAGAVSAVGVSSGAPVAVSKGISARGAIFTVSAPSAFIGSDSLLANILAGLRLFFQQPD